ncbi:uncharacterized protein LOC110020453 [Phalaenopsis equestris]|uniref:uncharacterized protein LOC110020453 n=1 Tax=Phalaenopsis equestris TaxID=78828 RepID=UPI0009E3561F|nr:uncharacterized protein LOC110020453 [Phalaenopsis equestris]
MAKKKVVLKVSMEDAEKRAKAMRCAVGLHGVVSASHDGDNITVVGEGIDPVALAKLLRKKMGRVDLTMVTDVEEKKEEKKEAEAKSINNQPIVLIQPPCYHGAPHYYADDVCYPELNCSIL